MKGTLLLLGLAALGAVALAGRRVHAEEPATPAYVYGTFDEVTAESVTIRPRGANAAAVALKLTANTALGTAATATASDLAKGQVVAILVGTDGEPGAQAVAFTQPGDDNPHAAKLVGAVAWRLSFMLNRGQVPAGGPKPMVGSVSEVGDGRISVQNERGALTLNLAPKATVLKVAPAKAVGEFTTGRRAMALYLEADKSARAVLQMPEPRPRG